MAGESTKTGISKRHCAADMNWKKLTPAQFSDEELKLLRITTKHGQVIYETGVVDTEGEIWHHSESSAFPSRYLGNFAVHSEIYYVVIGEILF